MPTLDPAAMSTVSPFNTKSRSSRYCILRFFREIAPADGHDAAGGLYPKLISAASDVIVSFDLSPPFKVDSFSIS